MLEYFLSNGNEITFAALFIFGLYYTMKKNSERETQYQETIKNNQAIIVETVKALNGYEDLKEDVKKISEKIGA